MGRGSEYQKAAGSKSPADLSSARGDLPRVIPREKATRCAIRARRVQRKRIQARSDIAEEERTRCFSENGVQPMSYIRRHPLGYIMKYFLIEGLNNERGGKKRKGDGKDMRKEISTPRRRRGIVLAVPKAWEKT